MTKPSLALLRLQSDERLVALVQAGYERAFDALVERHRRALLRYARRLVGEARAEDAVQQALVSAWAALQRGDDVRDLGAWLHRIVHNTALNALRGQRDDYAELRDSLLAGGAPDEVVERQENVRETLETMAALPERQREALLRIAVEGRSQEEVAESLGLTHGAVRQLVHRARTTLRAAATALTPLPAATWLASVGTRSEPVVARIAEMVGAGSAGVGATLAKAGAVVVLAGGGVAAERGLVEHDRPPAVSEAVARAPEPRARDVVESSPGDSRGPVARLGDSGGSSGSGSGGSDSSGPGSGRNESSGPGPRRDGSRGSSGSGSRGSDSSGPGPGTESGGSDSSGPGSSGSGSSGSGSSGSGSSGSGSGGSDSSGSGSSGSGSSGSGSGSSASGSSGPGSGDPIVAPTPVPVPDESDGSGSSGSSGSGSSGSGSSGSGSGDSDSSGSGSGDSD